MTLNAGSRTRWLATSAAVGVGALLGTHLESAVLVCVAAALAAGIAQQTIP